MMINAVSRGKMVKQTNSGRRDSWRPKNDLASSSGGGDGSSDSCGLSECNDDQRRRRGSLFGGNVFFFALLVVTSLLAISPVAQGAQLPPVKRAAAPPDSGDRCRPTKPFRCPTSTNGSPLCISIQYLCDGAPDCQDGYDEDPRLCTAAKRPPVEETLNFLQTLISNHGPNYLEKLFGPKARDALAPLGGVQQVAVALSESETLEDFGKVLHLMRSDLEHLRNVFTAVESGDVSMLKSLGIRNSELTDVKFFLDKLVNTGFMD